MLRLPSAAALRAATRHGPLAAALDLSAPQLLLSSFALLIAIGTCGFLWLPGLWRGVEVGFVDALFMATSAVCVTGLTLFDVARQMTFWGQLWLLLLIQLGGLGILTLAALAAAALGRRSSLEIEEVVGGPASLLPAGSPGALVKAIVLATLGIEAAGAALLWAVWATPLGAGPAVWHAAFNAVSAFCNAGFSTFSDSLIGWAHDLPTLLVIGGLVVLGGIGFVVLEDLRARVRGQRRRLSAHSRVALGTTGLLLGVATALYWAFEADAALAPLGTVDGLGNAFFMAVTPRTAGFNTVDYDALSNPSMLLTIALMWIGGSPGSTAGGVKTTTFALVALLVVAKLRGRPHVAVAERSVPEPTVQRAVGLAAGGAVLLVVGTFVLLWTELPSPAANDDRGHFVRLLFEAQSALGTVGLSMGATSDLSVPGRLVVTLLMFMGRVGPLAVLQSMARRRMGAARYRLAREDLLVG